MGAFSKINIGNINVKVLVNALHKSNIPLNKAVETCFNICNKSVRDVGFRPLSTKHVGFNGGNYAYKEEKQLRSKQLQKSINNISKDNYQHISPKMFCDHCGKQSPKWSCGACGVGYCDNICQEKAWTEGKHSKNWCKRHTKNTLCNQLNRDQLRTLENRISNYYTHWGIGFISQIHKFTSKNTPVVEVSNKELQYGKEMQELANHYGYGWQTQAMLDIRKNGGTTVKKILAKNSEAEYGTVGSTSKAVLSNTKTILSSRSRLRSKLKSNKQTKLGNISAPILFGNMHKTLINSTKELLKGMTVERLKGLAQVDNLQYTKGLDRMIAFALRFMKVNAPITSIRDMFEFITNAFAMLSNIFKFASDGLTERVMSRISSVYLNLSNIINGWVSYFNFARGWIKSLFSITCRFIIHAGKYVQSKLMQIGKDLLYGLCNIFETVIQYTKDTWIYKKLRRFFLFIGLLINASISSNLDPRMQSKIKKRIMSLLKRSSDFLNEMFNLFIPGVVKNALMVKLGNVLRSGMMKDAKRIFGKWVDITHTITGVLKNVLEWVLKIDIMSVLIRMIDGFIEFTIAPIGRIILDSIQWKRSTGVAGKNLDAQNRFKSNAKKIGTAIGDVVDNVVTEEELIQTGDKLMPSVKEWLVKLNIWKRDQIIIDAINKHRLSKKVLPGQVPQKPLKDIFFKKHRQAINVLNSFISSYYKFTSFKEIIESKKYRLSLGMFRIDTSDPWSVINNAWRISGLVNDTLTTSFTEYDIGVVSRLRDMLNPLYQHVYRIKSAYSKSLLVSINTTGYFIQYLEQENKFINKKRDKVLIQDLADIKVKDPFAPSKLYDNIINEGTEYQIRNLYDKMSSEMEVEFIKSTGDNPIKITVENKNKKKRRKLRRRKRRRKRRRVINSKLTYNKELITDINKYGSTFNILDIGNGKDKNKNKSEETPYTADPTETLSSESEEEGTEEEGTEEEGTEEEGTEKKEKKPVEKKPVEKKPVVIVENTQKNQYEESEEEGKQQPVDPIVINEITERYKLRSNKKIKKDVSTTIKKAESDATSESEETASNINSKNTETTTEEVEEILKEEETFRSASPSINKSVKNETPGAIKMIEGGLYEFDYKASNMFFAQEQELKKLPGNYIGVFEGFRQRYTLPMVGLIKRRSKQKDGKPIVPEIDEAIVNAQKLAFIFTTVLTAAVLYLIYYYSYSTIQKFFGYGIGEEQRKPEDYQFASTTNDKYQMQMKNGEYSNAIHHKIKVPDEIVNEAAKQRFELKMKIMSINDNKLKEQWENAKKNGELPKEYLEDTKDKVRLPKWNIKNVPVPPLNEPETVYKYITLQISQDSEVKKFMRQNDINHEVALESGLFNDPVLFEEKLQQYYSDAAEQSIKLEGKKPPTIDYGEGEIEVTKQLYSFVNNLNVEKWRSKKSERDKNIGESMKVPKLTERSSQLDQIYDLLKTHNTLKVRNTENEEEEITTTFNLFTVDIETLADKLELERQKKLKDAGKKETEEEKEENRVRLGTLKSIETEESAKLIRDYIFLRDNKAEKMKWNRLTIGRENDPHERALDTIADNTKSNLFVHKEGVELNDILENKEGKYKITKDGRSKWFNHYNKHEDYSFEDPLYNKWFTTDNSNVRYGMHVEENIIAITEINTKISSLQSRIENLSKLQQVIMGEEQTKKYLEYINAIKSLESAIQKRDKALNNFENTFNEDLGKFNERFLSTTKTAFEEQIHIEGKLKPNIGGNLDKEKAKKVIEKESKGLINTVFSWTAEAVTSTLLPGFVNESIKEEGSVLNTVYDLLFGTSKTVAQEFAYSLTANEAVIMSGSRMVAYLAMGSLGLTMMGLVSIIIGLYIITGFFALRKAQKSIAPGKDYFSKAYNIKLGKMEYNREKDMWKQTELKKDITQKDIDIMWQNFNTNVVLSSLRVWGRYMRFFFGIIFDAIAGAVASFIEFVAAVQQQLKDTVKGIVNIFSIIMTGGLKGLGLGFTLLGSWFGVPSMAINLATSSAFHFMKNKSLGIGWKESIGIVKWNIARSLLVTGIMRYVLHWFGYSAPSTIFTLLPKLGRL